jgi:hypothetical protein
LGSGGNHECNGDPLTWGGCVDNVANGVWNNISSQVNQLEKGCVGWFQGFQCKINFPDSGGASNNNSSPAHHKGSQPSKITTTCTTTTIPMLNTKTYREGFALNYFISVGLKDFQAAGIVGNLFSESDGLNSTKIETSCVTPTTTLKYSIPEGCGYGIA